MAYSTVLADRIRRAIARRSGVVEQKMFGGIAFMLRGNLCVGVWKDSLVARVGAEQYADALREPHVEEFKVTGRPMKGWVLVASERIADDDELADWVDRCAEFVNSLPRK